MSRRCGETIEVRRRDEAPEQFLWRGRLYVVRAVLTCWVESGGWWRSAAARPLFGVEEASGLGSAGSSAGPGPESGSDDLRLTPIPAAPKWGQRAWGEPASDIGASVGSIAVDDGERECWRVEAGAGRAADTGVYDLCFDWSAGTWTITRVRE